MFGTSSAKKIALTVIFLWVVPFLQSTAHLFRKSSLHVAPYLSENSCIHLSIHMCFIVAWCHSAVCFPFSILHLASSFWLLIAIWSTTGVWMLFTESYSSIPYSPFIVSISSNSKPMLMFPSWSKLNDHDIELSNRNSFPSVKVFMERWTWSNGCDIFSVSWLWSSQILHLVWSTCTNLVSWYHLHFINYWRLWKGQYHRLPEWEVCQKRKSRWRRKIWRNR